MALIDLVIAKVKDDSGRLADLDDYQPAIDEALTKYSTDRPGELVEDCDGQDSHDVDLPEGWVDGFSRLVRVEYPVGEVPEVVLDSRRYAIYRSPDATALRLLDVAPATGASVRVTYTVPRAEADVATADFSAVANLAAAICCEVLANLFAQTSDPTIAADVVNYRTKSAEFAARARRLRQLYQDHMGIAADGGAPAAAVVAHAPVGTRPRLTH